MPFEDFDNFITGSSIHTSNNNTRKGGISCHTERFELDHLRVSNEDFYYLSQKSTS